MRGVASAHVECVVRMAAVDVVQLDEGDAATIGAACRLVIDVFTQFEGAHTPPDGMSEFARFVNPTTISRRLSLGRQNQIRLLNQHNQMHQQQQQQQHQSPITTPVNPDTTAATTTANASASATAAADTSMTQKPEETEGGGAFAFVAVPKGGGGGVVGVIMVRDVTHVCLMFVDPGHHRRGVARALWDRALSHIAWLVSISPAPSCITPSETADSTSPATASTSTHSTTSTKAGGGFTVTVNSSTYAVGVYSRFGFVPTGPEQTKNGLTFTPMYLSMNSN
ncbi:hypothetical protein Pelo_14213 [Pelomyxa schiedti]|nr:hypothetical protein Pelo_14213 [Pelomyxa schiedti]